MAVLVGSCLRGQIEVQEPNRGQSTNWRKGSGKCQCLIPMVQNIGQSSSMGVVGVIGDHIDLVSGVDCPEVVCVRG